MRLRVGEFFSKDLEKMSKTHYFIAMYKLIDKFSNPNGLLKIIFLLVGALAVHINFLSSYMGR